ncbi:hypothetical protein Cgig2_015228 [Carnegiea gigantea]|uniref:BED-type domain-containing protein n=1 Tax=Carnegiea gigantea TaxID=171969 RepID=A0A9Q1QJU3_9CARY|nr:hypothetical protein Cgig2_015228 [Carnegiea gigantea]
MAPQCGSRGRGRRGSGFGTSAFPSPSPLVRIHQEHEQNFGGSSTPCTPFTVELDDNSPSTKKRRWTSSVWKHYNIKEGKHFPDAKDRAYCKYCNGGPIDADSSNGTSNFRRHTETCSARVSGDVGQMILAKDGKLVRKFNRYEYKELLALAIIKHGDSVVNR